MLKPLSELVMERLTPIRSWFDGPTLGRVFTCECGVWRLNDYELDNNDIVIMIAQHWIHDHDHKYEDVTRWVNENWGY